MPDEFPVNQVGQKEIKSEPTRTDEGEKDREESSSNEKWIWRSRYEPERDRGSRQLRFTHLQPGSRFLNPAR